MGVCTDASFYASFMGEGQETSASEMVPAPPPCTDARSTPADVTFTQVASGGQRTHFVGSFGNLSTKRGCRLSWISPLSRAARIGIRAGVIFPTSSS